MWKICVTCHRALIDLAQQTLAARVCASEVWHLAFSRHRVGWAAREHWMAALVPFAISGRAAMKWREAKVATCAPKLGSRTSSARTCEERCREGDHCGLQKYPLLRPPIPRHRIVTSTRRPATAVHHTANCAPSLTSPSLYRGHITASAKQARLAAVAHAARTEPPRALARQRRPRRPRVLLTRA